MLSVILMESVCLHYTLKNHICVFLHAVPVDDLFHLIDFKQVRWDLIFDILPTWNGMVSRMGAS
jgi:hypothetical protein